MPDIFYLISRWWKQMLLIIILAVLAAAAVVLFQRPCYLSVATALPANPELADKASIFNTNIQSLYSSLGGADELDVIVGTAQLDTAYISVAQAFNIWDHYKTEGKESELLINAATVLKKNTRVIKSDFGELKVKVWDTDKNLAPQLANAIMEKLNEIHQAIQNESNRAFLVSLQASRTRIIKYIDSINVFLRSADITPEQAQSYTSRRTAYTEQLQQYEKLIEQYRLIVDSKPSVLMTVERARAADKPDRPELWLVLAATAFVSFLFGLLLALVLERRKIKTA